MKVVAVVLAAGSGSRFGSDKVRAILGDKEVWQWSFDTLATHPKVAGVGIVASAANRSELEALATGALFVVRGGGSRMESSRIACDHVPRDTEVVLIQDAARPFLASETIDAVIEGASEAGAAAPGVGLPDTVKQIDGDRIRTLDRSSLVAMQTPQGARLDLLMRAHANESSSHAASCTDELSLLEAIGVFPRIVAGRPEAFKITSREDLVRARAMLASVETRTGIGYDVHRFSTEPSRALWLGGVRFDGHPGLEGHSDADVVMHAAADALLGAASLGDIGQHFPNDDLRWRNEPSATFLVQVARLLADRGWAIVNLDVAVVAETPKIAAAVPQMREAIGGALGIGADRVSVKATTNERLGSIGRSEGIAAFATATIRSA